MRNRSPRYSHVAHVRVATPRGPTGARIDNLSATGARLRGVHGLKKGERVAIGLRGRGVVASVVWIKGGLAGLHFEVPLEAPHLRSMLGPGVELRTALAAAVPDGPVTPRQASRSCGAAAS
ncbi:MAG: PilZ domain-containing protein [Hasllibacter sp.]